MSEILWTLDELNRFEPDREHFDSTLTNARDHTGFDEFERMWRRELVPLGQIDRNQIVEDPDEIDMEKVSRIMAVAALGEQLPHVVIIHYPGSVYPYQLIEGRHRLNAYYRLQVAGAPFTAIPAFVAHAECCSRGNAPGGPTRR